MGEISKYIQKKSFFSKGGLSPPDLILLNSNGRLASKRKELNKQEKRQTKFKEWSTIVLNFVSKAFYSIELLPFEKKTVYRKKNNTKPQKRCIKEF